MGMLLLWIESEVSWMGLLVDDLLLFVWLDVYWLLELCWVDLLVLVSDVVYDVWVMDFKCRIILEVFDGFGILEVFGDELWFW